uniref:small ribosomal subunit protein uS9m isoform X2 n=1 Tax=Myxine glutinosa TaxID=7769 RepID=UPI00358EABDD
MGLMCPSCPLKGLPSSGCRQLQLAMAAAAAKKQYTEEYIRKQVEEFQFGRRHLANMMGENPDNFTQEDVDRAIRYLLPSALHEKRARPIMKHPKEIFPKRKVAQWGADGHPFNFLFFTGKHEYYNLMHDTYALLVKAEAEEDHRRAIGEEMDPLTFNMSRWVNKDELYDIILENLSDKNYSDFIQLCEKLLANPCARLAEEHLHTFRKDVFVKAYTQVVTPLQYDEAGRAFSQSNGTRKSAHATVTLMDAGTGEIIVNGLDYLEYFPVLQDREQLMFAFQFIDRLGKHDTVCSVTGGGHSSQAGAIRHAISLALVSFLQPDEVESMRRAGLLTKDPRRRERKKPGQEGARRKFTWSKR